MGYDVYCKKVIIVEFAINISSFIFFYVYNILIVSLQTSGINGIPSELTSTMASLGNAPSSKKGETNEESAGELGARNQPTIFNNYLYPG